MPEQEEWVIGFDHKRLKWPVPFVKRAVDESEVNLKGLLAAYAEKLEAEDSIRTAATLIIGFSFSLITSASNKGRGGNDSCERGPPICIEPKTVYQVHLVFLVMASVCGAVSIMFTTGLSFKGQRGSLVRLRKKNATGLRRLLRSGTTRGTRSGATALVTCSWDLSPPSSSPLASRPLCGARTVTLALDLRWCLPCAASSAAPSALALCLSRSTRRVRRSKGRRGYRGLGS